MILFLIIIFDSWSWLSVMQRGVWRRVILKQWNVEATHEQTNGLPLYLDLVSDA